MKLDTMNLQPNGFKSLPYLSKDGFGVCSIFFNTDNLELDAWGRGGGGL